MGTNGQAVKSRGAKRTARLEPGRVRRDFPVLRHKQGRHPLVYLDSAATAQKPRVVIDRIAEFYSAEYAKNETPYRFGKHATDAYEASRSAVAKFLNADSPDCIVFNQNSTEAINTVANGFSRGLLSQGDEILISTLEHHSNIVLWHLRTSAACRYSLTARSRHPTSR